MYGDILKSKKTLGWRTMLVFPELAMELATLGANRVRGGGGRSGLGDAGRQPGVGGALGFWGEGS